MKNGHAEVVKLLVNAGCIEGLQEDGRIWRMCEEGRADIFKVLIECRVSLPTGEYVSIFRCVFRGGALKANLLVHFCTSGQPDPRNEGFRDGQRSCVERATNRPRSSSWQRCPEQGTLGAKHSTLCCYEFAE
jgi:hypothetical protein